MTVGDKIRSLTDEELARWLVNLRIDYVEQFFKANFIPSMFKPPTKEQRKELFENLLEILRREAIIDDQRRQNPADDR